MQETHGLCALMWLRSNIDIDLTGTTLQPDLLEALGRSLRTSLKNLTLEGTNFAKDGNDLSGFRVFCSHLKHAGAPLTLNIGNNSLKPDAAMMLSEAVKGNETLQTLKYVPFS